MIDCPEDPAHLRERYVCASINGTSCAICTLCACIAMAADDCTSFVGYRHGSVLLEFVSHAGKPGVEEGQRARMKIVGVARLRRALAMQGSIRKVIALDEGDAVEVGCKNTSGFREDEMVLAFKRDTSLPIWNPSPKKRQRRDPRRRRSWSVSRAEATRVQLAHSGAQVNDPHRPDWHSGGNNATRIPASAIWAQGCFFVCPKVRPSSKIAKSTL